MEAIILDESMELAPDTARYFDPQDDIEIDLDEVAAPNHDVDVIVDDASMAGSDHPEATRGTHESVRDADMIDDGHGAHHIEGIHKRAEEDYQFINDALDIDHQSYEMEDDYEEDIDAPIPGTGVMEPDAPANSAPSAEMAEEGYHGLENEPAERVEPNGRSDLPEENTPLEPKEEREEAHMPPIGEQEQNTEVKLGDGEPEHLNIASDEQLQNSEDLEHEEQIHEVKSQAEGIAPGNVDENTTDQVDEEAAVLGKNEIGAHESGISMMHNVQVLYQDSEISLFPPKEDDLSETYFLEDEALAHEPIGDLLNACRVVLGDHMGTEEELYMDIECLGIHLTEATRSPISLSQVVQVYLDLCRNDGDTNPGPLYITLATQPSFTQNFTNLSEAAQSGKGLAHVSKWDEYEDQIVFEEHGATGNQQEEEEPENTESREKVEEPEFSVEKPTTPQNHPEMQHEEGNEEEAYANEGIEINANETEEQEAQEVQPVPAEVTAEAPDIEANQLELEEATHKRFSPNEGAEQEITEENIAAERVEEPSHGGVQEEEENAQSPVPDNEDGESSVPDPSRDTNTEPTHEIVADAREDFIEIDLEAFDKESHVDDGHVEDDSSYPSHEQAAEPSTPEPSYNPLEVDEDIFKSPTAAQSELPHESFDDQDIGRSDVTADLTEIHDENQVEIILPADQTGDGQHTSAVPAEEDQAQDFNTIEVIDSATGETLSEPHVESKELEEDVEDVVYAGSAELEADGHYDAPEDQDLVDLEEEPYQTEVLDGEYLGAHDAAENQEVPEPALEPEPETNGTALNGTNFREQSPKAGKRPRADDESISISNQVPVIKKPRAE
ncbi:hypothetical protein MGYG_07147 [Nannizzia gypsea CBS 118893]|uniref:Uncharacterized protein n=1 Tax=Arthroderma gypseum (strain ATCC MYA-4604 / CBS 118893) TaxID=535722 RepID=E4V275_ARTGP|nr:hypothetical protein MGYG_07147 [Nannizzia gypsea CBS 118893]EFR04140.1 hypothetical protein MGYG_07147 [Nannizzia gypsea CBS 118893]